MANPRAGPNLEPSTQLSPGKEPGAWAASGPDPYFIVRRALAPGWIRIRLDMESETESSVELRLAGAGDGEPIPLGEVRQHLRVDRYLRLDSTVSEVRLDPLDRPGAFRINEFSIERVSRLGLLLRSVRAKLKELRARRNFGSAVRHGLRLLFSGEWRTFKAKLVQSLGGAPAGVSLYQVWLEQCGLTDADRARMRAEAEKMANPPRISILMPLLNMHPERLRGALESVARQVYPHWELCAVSTEALPPLVRAVVEEYAARDKRIRGDFEPRDGAVPALNAELGIAAGHFITVLLPFDLLAEDALFAVAQAAQRSPETDVFYGDEDQLDRLGRLRKPFFKPDWSPEYFLAYPYTGRFSVYRTALVREAGGFPRLGFACVLMLRLLARGARIGRVPSVLSHTFAVADRAAGQECPAYSEAAPEEARLAVQEYLAATGQEGTVEAGPAPGTHRVRFAIQGRPKVSIIIPSRCQPPKAGGVPYVVRCVESVVQKSTYKDYEILVLDRNEMPAALEAQLKALGVRRATYEEPFNWSRVNNLGARQAPGSQLLFLNDDVEVITPDWLERLLEYSQQAAIGAVGAKLLFPNGRLQHTGVTIHGGNPGHPYYNVPDGPGYFFSNLVPRNYSAVTGACLMTRAEVFQALGGFDESFGLNYNDVDYCLRVIRGGRRVVYTPYAQLYHHESVSKAGVFAEELARFKARWPEWCEDDPYFSVHALEFADA